MFAARATRALQWDDGMAADFAGAARFRPIPGNRHSYAIINTRAASFLSIAAARVNKPLSKVINLPT